MERTTKMESQFDTKRLENGRYFPQKKIIIATLKESHKKNNKTLIQQTGKKIIFFPVINDEKMFILLLNCRFGLTRSSPIRWMLSAVLPHCAN